MAWVFRTAESRDLTQLLPIEQACFPEAWSMPMLRKEFQHHWSTFRLLEWRDPLAQDEPFIAGFTLYWFVVDELHLMQIAVAPEHQRKGLGRRLMKDLMLQLRQRQGVRILLEVRRSNEAAIALYKDLKFEEIGVRKGYYSEPKEDAIVLAYDAPAPCASLRS